MIQPPVPNMPPTERRYSFVAIRVREKSEGKMGKEIDDLRRIVGKVPWLTSKGFDIAKFPIDGVLRRSLAEEEREFNGALSTLQAMHRAGRREAGIFLLGLLAGSGDNWNRRIDIAKRLEGFKDKGCADYCLSELKRVKSNNSTRRYLDVLLKVLEEMPLELAQPGLLALISDRLFSQRMRDKFIETLDEVSRRRSWPD